MSDRNWRVDVAIDAARRYLDNSSELMYRQAGDSIDVVKINLVVLAAVPTAIRFFEIPAIALAIPTVGSSLAIGTAMFAYQKVSPTLGPDPSAITRLINGEEGFEPSDLAKAYGAWAQQSGSRHERIARWLFSSLVLTIFSIGGFVGMLLALA